MRYDRKITKTNDLEHHEQTTHESRRYKGDKEFTETKKSRGAQKDYP
jgi:hypothetical protein